MKLKDILLIISSSVILTSCNYLDVVPSEIPQLSDAFKNEATAQNYIMGMFTGIFQQRARSQKILLFFPQMNLIYHGEMTKPILKRTIST